MDGLLHALPRALERRARSQHRPAFASARRFSANAVGRPQPYPWLDLYAFTVEKLGHLRASRHAHRFSFFSARSNGRHRRRSRLPSLSHKLRPQHCDRTHGDAPRLPLRAPRRDGQYHQPIQSHRRQQRDRRAPFSTILRRRRPPFCRTRPVLRPRRSKIICLSFYSRFFSPQPFPRNNSKSGPPSGTAFIATARSFHPPERLTQASVTASPPASISVRKFQITSPPNSAISITMAILFSKLLELNPTFKATPMR